MARPMAGQETAGVITLAIGRAAATAGMAAGAAKEIGVVMDSSRNNSPAASSRAPIPITSTTTRCARAAATPLTTATSTANRILSTQPNTTATTIQTQMGRLTSHKTARGQMTATLSKTTGPPPTIVDRSYNSAGGQWCWIPYSGSPYYGAAPPTFESFGPTYERGPIYHGPFQGFYSGPGDAAPYNTPPNASPASGPTDQSNSPTSSQATGGNGAPPTLTPAH